MKNVRMPDMFTVADMEDGIHMVSLVFRRAEAFMSREYSLGGV